MKWPMRALAITGIETVSMISRMMRMEAMRATPPSLRISAGTRSSAMTAEAPALSAIFACSTLVTSMMTPPLSISARPTFSRNSSERYIILSPCIAPSSRTWRRRVELGVDAAQFDREGYSIEGEHIRRCAVVDGVLFGVGDHVVEAVHHNLFQAIVDHLLIPEIALAILHPLEIRDRDAAGVGQNIRDHEDALLPEDGIGEVGSGTVGAFAQDFRSHFGRILGSDYVLARGGQEDIGFQEQSLLAVHVLASGEIGDGAGFLAVLHKGGNIQALRIIDGAVEFNDADDLESGAGHQLGRHATDVAESLD